MAGLFDKMADNEYLPPQVAPRAGLLRRVAPKEEFSGGSSLEQGAAKAPFRRMITPGGFRMSVAMANCGALGWVTVRTGYRYDEIDPESGGKMAGNARLFSQSRHSGRRRGRLSWFCPRCLPHQSL